MAKSRSLCGLDKMEQNSVYTSSAAKRARLKRKKRLHQKYRILLGIWIVILLIFAGIAYQNRHFTKLESIRTVSEEDNSRKNMEVYQDGIVRYTEKQVTYYDADGKKVWSKKYSAINPEVKVCGQYIMIADKQNNEIYVFDKKGKSHKFSTEYAIADAEIAEQGVVAVALTAKNTNYIEMHRISGGKLVSIQSSINENGYPLDITLSPNGKILCASYFIVDGVQTKNRLTFYDFSKDGEKTENILGGYDYENTIVPTVAFLKEDTLCAFGDDKISIYHINKKVKLQKEIEMESHIESIAYDQSHIAIVRERNADEDGEDGNDILEIFSLNGNRVGKVGVSGDYTDMTLSRDRIILSSAYQSVIFTPNGRQLLDYNFKKRMIQIVPAKQKQKYFISYQSQLDLAKLKE